IGREEGLSMSGYHDFRYEPPAPARRDSAPALAWLVVLCVFAAVLMGGLLFLACLGRLPGGMMSQAEPRAGAPRGALAADEQATIDLFKAVSPSVVHVTNLAAQRDPFSRNVQAVPRGTGTGFIWDDNGFIVTNFHVVEGASAARVILADRS